MDGALDGLVVLDLTNFLSGPYCTMLLGDMGADVIKVERPDGGDDARRMPPFVEGRKGPASAPFGIWNRNKRSIALDLKQPDDLDVVRRMRARRCAGGEFPPRRAGPPGPRLGGAGGGQSAADLCAHLRLRPDRPLGRAWRARHDGAGHVRADGRQWPAGWRALPAADRHHRCDRGDVRRHRRARRPAGAAADRARPADRPVAVRGRAVARRL